eukprot:3876548-Pleurochrysis_carterae.AAC.1
MAHGIEQQQTSQQVTQHNSPKGGPNRAHSQPQSSPSSSQHPTVQCRAPWPSSSMSAPPASPLYPPAASPMAPVSPLSPLSPHTPSMHSTQRHFQQQQRLSLGHMQMQVLQPAQFEAPHCSSMLPPALTLYNARELAQSTSMQSTFGLPPHEAKIEDFSCAVKKRILLHGRMFISSEHVCFRSDIFGLKTTVVVAFREEAPSTTRLEMNVARQPTKQLSHACHELRD